MTEKNLNIDDYSIPELMELLEIDELTPELIKQKANAYIESMNEENNTEMVSFFTEVKTKLLDSYDSQRVENWYKNEYITTPNEVLQNAKITSRKNKVEEFNGVLKQERLAINQSKVLPFAQGEINPTLRNQIHKIINIDSTFRTNSVPTLKSAPFLSTGIGSATHFTSDLSEPLTRVLTLKMYSIQIPYTWYNISEGRNSYSYKNVVYSLPPGNYTIGTIQTAISTLTAPELTLNVSAFSTTGKVSFESNSITIEEIVFFSTSGGLSNEINNTLGWTLGFREPCYKISVSNPTQAEAIADLNGPKYLLLYLDEFNMNRVNKGMVSIEDTETKLSVLIVLCNLIQ